MTGLLDLYSTTWKKFQFIFQCFVLKKVLTYDILKYVKSKTILKENPHVNKSKNKKCC